jgi:hypothetical protein
METVAFPKKVEPVLRSKARYKILKGGRGRGASWTIARALLLKSSEKKLRILCAREIQNSIKDSVHKLLCDQISILNLDQFFDIQRDSITSKCGSEFIFKGLSRNITEIKSTEGIDICWIAEAERITDESWDVLIPTIRKNDSEIWIDFNPGLDDSPTSKRFLATEPPNSVSVHMTYEDNPWFPDVLREEMEYCRKQSEAKYKHIWLGEPVSDGEYPFRLIEPDSIDALAGVVLDEPVSRKLISCDPSQGGDACSIGRFENTRLVQKKRINFTDTMKIVGELLIEGKQHGTDYFAVDAIGIGAGICDRLEEMGKKVIRIISSESARQPDRYANRRSEMWGYTQEQILKRDMHPITDEKVRKHLTAVCYDPKALNSKGFIKLVPKQETKKLLKESPDDGDMFVYGIWALREVPYFESEASGEWGFQRRKPTFSGAGGW